ncbi:hypothetical protein ACP70R_004706 [Stipagrostis hirtigluma subsp. patula]
MAFGDTAARKLLHGGAIAQGVADVGGISFGLDGLWQLVAGFFAGILARLLDALAGAAHLLVLPLEALWQWLVASVAAAAGAVRSDFAGMWQSVKDFFANIFVHLFAAATSAAHELVLPLEALWRWLATTVADVAGAVSFNFDGMWQSVKDFFAGIFVHLFAAATSEAHEVVRALEALWRWLATTVADAAGAVCSDFHGMWQSVKGFFAGIFVHLFAAATSAAHEVVSALEALWRWLVTTVADAAGATSSGFDGMWQFVKGFFAGIFIHLFAAATSAAHEVVPALEALWGWLQSAAAAALLFVLGLAAVLLLAALVFLFWPALCAAALWICIALVYAACFFVLGLFIVGAAVARALSWLLPRCVQCLHCCADVTMKAPGAAGMLISREAFEANTVLYFQILHDAGGVVAATVFRTVTVASAVAAPIAALFGAGRRITVAHATLDRLFAIVSCVKAPFGTACAPTPASVPASDPASSELLLETDRASKTAPRSRWSLFHRLLEAVLKKPEQKPEP